MSVKLCGSFTRQEATRGTRLQNLETETVDNIHVCVFERGQAYFSKELVNEIILRAALGQFGEISDGMAKDGFVFM